MLTLARVPNPEVDRLQRRRQRFGDRLRETRLERNLTQQRLAELAEMDRAYLVGLEHGKQSPTLDRVFALADALGVPLTTLVEGVD